jgi:hypothetical protein
MALTIMTSLIQKQIGQKMSITLFCDNKGVIQKWSNPGIQKFALPQISKHRPIHSTKSYSIRFKNQT